MLIFGGGGGGGGKTGFMCTVFHSTLDNKLHFQLFLNKSLYFIFKLMNKYKGLKNSNTQKRRKKKLKKDIERNNAFLNFQSSAKIGTGNFNH